MKASGVDDLCSVILYLECIFKLSYSCSLRYIRRNSRFLAILTVRVADSSMSTRVSLLAKILKYWFSLPYANGSVSQYYVLECEGLVLRICAQSFRSTSFFPLN